MRDLNLTKEEHLQRVLDEKKAMKKELIKLPFEEKIRRVIEMQKVTREFSRDKSKKIYVWNL